MAVLAVIEDISALNEEEELALHNANTVARVITVLDLTVEKLLSPPTQDTNTEYLFVLLKRILIILSNLS